MSRFGFLSIVAFVVTSGAALSGPAACQAEYLLDRSDLTNEAVIIRNYLNEIRANRLNAGLSLGEFHTEMMQLAPDIYWNFIVLPRLCQEAEDEFPGPKKGHLGFCNKLIARSKVVTARRNTIRAEFDEHRAPQRPAVARHRLGPGSRRRPADRDRPYARPQSNIQEYQGPPWLSELLYRSKRLLHGATEDQVRCEVAYQDLYYEKKIKAQGFDTDKCDRPF